MSLIRQTALAAKEASRVTASLPTDVKNRVLLDLANSMDERRAEILAANEKDMTRSREAGLGQAKLKRLLITDAGIDQMRDGLRTIVELPDPVGAVTRETVRPNGLKVRKVRCPLGVIAMIYEARPNVTIDAFSLCFKAGNACLLKGGKEAAASNECLAELARECLRAHTVPEASIAVLTAMSRDDIRELLQLSDCIDLVIPRGGEELIRFVHEHSRIPMVQHFQGVCHIFVDESADLDNAVDLCVTAKTSGPATCNAVECLLIHRDVAERFVPRLVEEFRAQGVEVRGDPAVCKLAPAAVPAKPDDWGKEFLDLIVAVKTVGGIDDAIDHINRYGSCHTEAILTTNEAHQRQFLDRVQSSCTLVNASTRFNDGFQLGLGAEIGISTSKIHAYGPMGLEELTTQRYVVLGSGQMR